MVPTILGPAMSGKSTFIRIVHHLLENTMINLEKVDTKIDIFSLNTVGYPEYMGSNTQIGLL